MDRYVCAEMEVKAAAVVPNTSICVTCDSRGEAREQPACLDVGCGITSDIIGPAPALRCLLVSEMG